MTPEGVTLAPPDLGEEIRSTLTFPKDETTLSEESQSLPGIESVLSQLDQLIDPQDIGDLEAAPGLDSYRDLAQLKKAPYLLRLSELLEEQGHPERAFLILERIIDTSSSQAPDHEAALVKMTALRPKLPPWHIEPEKTLGILIEIEIAIPTTTPLRLALLDLATQLSAESQSFVELTPKVTSVQTADPSSDQIVGIRLGLANTATPQSSRFSVALIDDQKALTEALAMACGLIVRQELRQSGFQAPPHPYITRLMWQSFADKLKDDSSQPSNLSPFPSE